MKYLALLAAGLSFTSALAVPPTAAELNALIPRAYGPALPNLMERGRGGGGGHSPEGEGSPSKPKPEDLPKDAQAVDRAVTEDTQKALENFKKVPTYKEKMKEAGWEPQMKDKPELGNQETGYYVNEKEKTFEVYYGMDIFGHAHNLKLNQKVNQDDPKNPPAFDRSSETEKKDNRKILNKWKETHPEGVLDEKDEASEEHAGRYQTVCLVSKQESQIEGSIMTSIRTMRDKPEYADFKTRKFDNRGEYEKDDPRAITDSIVYLIGPKNIDIGDGRGPQNPIVAITDKTTYTVSTGDKRTSAQRSKSGEGGGIPKTRDIKQVKGKKPSEKREVVQRDVILAPRQAGINQIQNQQGDDVDLNPQYRTEILDFFAQYLGTQDGITNAIWPVMETLLTNATADIVFEAALSIFSELTRAPIAVEGHFYAGMTSFTADEQKLKDEGASQEYLDTMAVVDAILVDAYETGYDNATAAANSTGLLLDIDILGRYIIPSNASLLPEIQTSGLDGKNFTEQFAAFIQDPSMIYTWDELIDSNSTNGTFANGTISSNSTMNSTNSTLTRRNAYAPVKLPVY